jgi:methylase of polypeptide subunit release factors
MGFDQADAVRAIAEDAGCYASVRVVKDYSGLDRVAIMAYSSQVAGKRRFSPHVMPYQR